MDLDGRVGVHLEGLAQVSQDLSAKEGQGKPPLAPQIAVSPVGLRRVLGVKRAPRRVATEAIEVA